MPPKCPDRHLVHPRRLPVFLGAAVFLLGTVIVRENVMAQVEEAKQIDDKQPNSVTDRFRVMTWNIWHGGREDGVKEGPRRVVDVIRNSRADIVAMQETYGSGELISEALKYHFQPRGTNVSIHSRFPVLEDLSVFQEFKCVGALLELPDRSKLAFFSIWLPYATDIWLPLSRESLTSTKLATMCDVSRDDLIVILDSISKKLEEEKLSDVPVIIAGDFNSMSHLDYTAHAAEEFEHVVPWPTSLAITKRGFRDAYRETNPVINRRRDATWSPRFIEQEQDRIDFIYYKSMQWRCLNSQVIREHPSWFPSDHAAVVAEFRRQTKPVSQNPLRVVSYNIKHGQGTDGQQSLMRSAKVLHDLNADIIGLQEVDQRCRRSGNVNQIAEVSKRLNMHGSFCAFMPYDGGQYGLGLLSAHPIVEIRSLSLPEGGEPRVALVAKIRLPNNAEIYAVNVHFDWVRDDAVRIRQASVVAEFLAASELPWILLGDFNDVVGSRTLNAFEDIGVRCTKSQDSRFTFSSMNPDKEIDFIFVSPREDWKVRTAKAVDQPTISDHLPVISELVLPPGEN